MIDKFIGCFRVSWLFSRGRRIEYYARKIQDSNLTERGKAAFIAAFLCLLVGFKRFNRN